MLVRGAMGMQVNERLPEQASGILVLTAAQSDQIASWDEKAEHGLFTMNLLAALAGAADQDPTGDGNGDVTLDEVKAYLDRHMTRAARRIYARVQTATAQGAGNVVLATYTPGPAAEPVATLSWTVDEMDLDMYALKNANVRVGPSSTDEKLATLDKGSRVTVTGKVEGRNWYRVALAGNEVGFIFGTLLGEDAPEALQTATVVPVPEPGTKTSAQPVVGIYPPAYQPGDRFKDCDACPEMIVVPAGSFRMGDLDGGGYRYEKPVHRVTIPQPFAVGIYEVTFAQWDACVAGGGCSGYRPKDRGWGRGERPVMYVSWEDAKAYVSWLKRKTSLEYRLLSEAEWEYAARAGTTTKYHWGNSFDASRANIGRKTVPVGRYEANRFGLHDMHGNVWEWVEDCWHYSYAGAPSDSRAWASGDDCALRVLRGHSWYNLPRLLRAAGRYGFDVDLRGFNLGFRVARTLFTP